MERSETRTLQAFFNELLAQEPDLHEGILQQKAIQWIKERLDAYWQDIQSLHISDGTIYIRTYSHALMQTLTLMQADLKDEVNQAIGTELIDQIKVSLSSSK